VTAPNTDSSHPETLAFVAPGLIHRFGNLIFTVQGQAQLLTRSEGSDREVTAITNAAERGGRLLGVLRTLLGPTSGPPQDAVELLEHVVDLVRIPLREAGYALTQAVPESPGFRGVDPGMFCPAVLEAVRLFAEALPEGQGGKISIELADGARRSLLVRIGHTAEQGVLPFPLATAQLQASIEAATRSLLRRPRISVDDAGIELMFGTTAAQPEGTAELGK